MALVAEKPTNIFAVNDDCIDMGFNGNSVSIEPNTDTFTDYCNLSADTMNTVDFIVDLATIDHESSDPDVNCSAYLFKFSKENMKFLKDALLTICTLLGCNQDNYIAKLQEIVATLNNTSITSSSFDIHTF